MVKRGKSDFIKINNEDIIFSKQGLSSIVATLIIILLVIVVAGIIWVVVKNVVQEGSEDIGLGKFTLDLQIERAQIEDGDVTVVVVRRNPGKGDFIGMNFIFYDGENTEIIREDTILEELGVKSFTFTLTQISTINLKTISVSPIFRLSSGKESVGDVTSSMEIKEGMWVGTGESEQTPFELLGFKGMGTVDYTISGGQGQINFTRAIVDPLDVLPGHNQTFTVYLTSIYPIINVTSFTQLDNSNSTLIFEKISEDEIWIVSWIVNDVHATTYRTNITATDSEGNSDSIALTWTDSCQSLVTHGQDIEITGPCSTIADSVGGLDGGNLTIASGVIMTLNSGSVWAFNEGKEIKISGAIAKNISGGGSISKGYLHYYDVDGDGYAPNTTVIFSTSSSLFEKTRAKDMTAIPTTSAYTIDCCDTETNAHPYQTEYFTTARTGCGGGYNYSCDPWSSVPTKQWTDIGNCYVCGWDLVCDFTPSGAIGWDGLPVPDCGVSRNYITDPGTPCDQRPDSLSCSEECLEATIESRTQACR